MDMYGKLVGREVVPCSHDEALPQWSNKFDRRVALDEFDGVRVSTVFLVLNHSFGDGPPLWFETMVFGGADDQYCDRYSTWEAAENGHRAIVAKLKAGERLDTQP
jgi:hypothetical protein